MLVEDQLDRRVGRIGGVEKLEEVDEFAAAVAILDQRVDLSGDEVDAGQQADCAVALIFMLAREVGPDDDIAANDEAALFRPGAQGSGDDIPRLIEVSVEIP
jgi:hypothetical protein